MASIPLLQTTDPSLYFSRWVSLTFLIDLEEMTLLLHELSPLHLLTTTPLNQEDPFYLKKEAFLKIYSYYISELKQGKTPKLDVFRPYFHLFLTESLDSIYRKEVAPHREVLKVNKPTLLVKPITLAFSRLDHSIRITPLNPEGILWGLQVSFPQLMQEEGSSEIKTINPQTNGNAQLFKKIRKWLREKTEPTHFLFQEKEIISPIRLGKKCLSWIQTHPQIQNELSIAL